MAFDSGMLSAVVAEINALARDARVDKINQPEKSEIVLTLRCEGVTRKLCISASSGAPRICFENSPKDNPKTAPSLCMSLRKHLGGSKLKECFLMGFERVVCFSFDARDELGYISEKRIYAEIMGKASGFILCDGNGKVITASRFVDLSANAQRKLIPGITYELPASQGKADPMCENKEEFLKKAESAAKQKGELFIRNTYMGISPLIAREIVYKVTGNVDSLTEDIPTEALWQSFSDTTKLIQSKNFTPTLIRDENGKNVDFTFMDIKQYGEGFTVEQKESVSELIEEYFATKNKAETARHYAHDIYTAVGNIQSKLSKKLIILSDELDECKKKDEYKHYGDLITANIYKIKQGDTAVRLVNYYKEDCPEETVVLDKRLSPSQNAQSYFKKYAKLKKGEIFKKEQIELAKRELTYIESVIESLDRAESDDEYSHIRDELILGGYMKKSTVTPGRKAASNLPVRQYLPSGRAVYVGKNNMQNDYIDSKLASKKDWWFHTKNYAGSHVVMISDDKEPLDEDFTNAARLAAYNSKARGGENVAVDYTLVKNLKKPAGSPPGFVTYLSNYTAYVDAILPEGIK